MHSRLPTWSASLVALAFGCGDVETSVTPAATGGQANVGGSAGSAGTTVLASRFIGPGWQLEARRLGSDGTWSVPTKLAESDTFTSTFLAGDGTGRMLAAWSTWSYGCVQQSAVAVRDASGVWQQPQAIFEAPVGQTVIAGASISASGHVAIVWSAPHPSSPNGCLSGMPRLSWYVPDKGWESPIVLDTKLGAKAFSLALAPTGRALVAWQRGDLVLARWVEPP